MRGVLRSDIVLFVGRSGVVFVSYGCKGRPWQLSTVMLVPAM